MQTRACTVTISVVVGPTNLFAEKKISEIQFPASPLPVSIPPTTFYNVGAARGDQAEIIPPTSSHPPYHFPVEVTEIASEWTRVRCFLTFDDLGIPK